MLVEIITVIAVVSGIITIIVFFTGKPSIFHFIPSKSIVLSDYLNPLFYRNKFEITDNKIALKNTKIGDIVIVDDIRGFKNFKVLLSPHRKRYLLINQPNHETVTHYESLLIFNRDGSDIKHHNFSTSYIPEGNNTLRFKYSIVDAKWFTKDSILLYLDASEIPNCFYNIPGWKYIGGIMHIPIENYKYGYIHYLEKGYYIINIDSSNEIVRIKKY